MENQMDLNESLYGETHSKIMSEVEKEVNLFQEKHQKWFDDNSEEGGVPMMYTNITSSSGIRVSLGMAYQNRQTCRRICRTN